MSRESKNAESALKSARLEIGEKYATLYRLQKQLDAYNTIVSGEYGKLIKRFCETEEGLATKDKLYNEICNKAKKEGLYAEFRSEVVKIAEEKGFCFWGNQRGNSIVVHFRGFEHTFCYLDKFDIKKDFERYKIFSQYEQITNRLEELQKYCVRQEKKVDLFYDEDDYIADYGLRKNADKTVYEIKNDFINKYECAKTLTFGLPVPYESKDNVFRDKEVEGLIKTMSGLFMACQEKEIPLTITCRKDGYYHGTVIEIIEED